MVEQGRSRTDQPCGLWWDFHSRVVRWIKTDYFFTRGAKIGNEFYPSRMVLMYLLCRKLKKKKVAGVLIYSKAAHSFIRAKYWTFGRLMRLLKQWHHFLMRFVRVKMRTQTAWVVLDCDSSSNCWTWADLNILWPSEEQGSARLAVDKQQAASNLNKNICQILAVVFYFFWKKLSLKHKLNCLTMKFSHRHIRWNTSMKSVRQRTERATLCLATANLTLQQCVTQIKWMSSNAAFWQFMKSPLLCCSSSDIRGFDQALLSQLTQHTLTHMRGTCGFVVVVVVIIVFCLLEASAAICVSSVALKTCAGPELQWPLNRSWISCATRVLVWNDELLCFIFSSLFLFFPFFLPGY